MTKACKTCAVSLFGMTIENKTQRKSPVLHTDEYCWEADVAKKMAPRPAGLGALHERGRLLPRLP